MGLQTKDATKQDEHKYHVAAWWASGQSGIAKADSAFNAIHFTAPPKFGGLEGRWTPEELLLCSLASCFTATFQAIAAAEQFTYIDLGADAEAIVRKSDSGFHFSEIVLRARLKIAREQDREAALELLHKTRMLCLVARTLAIPQKFEMQVDVSVSSPARGTSAEFSSSPIPAARGAQYSHPWKMKDGTDVVVRPICAEDESRLATFHETLSDRTVYFRYFQSVSLKSRVAHDRLARICVADRDRKIVLVADLADPSTGQHKILGIGRLNKFPETRRGEVAVLISDEHQRRGLGTELLRRLIQISRGQSLSSITSEMLRENLPMQALVKKLGFSLSLMNDLGSIKAFLIL